MVNIPNVEWIEQNPTVDPSGFRADKDPTKGFLKTLGTGAGEALDYGQLNTTGSGAITNTKLLYARVSDLGDASGVFNMRMFLSNTSAWGAGTYRFLESKRLHFSNGLELNSASNNTPTTVPTVANISGTITEPEFPLGKPWMSGIIDNDVSQYVYTAIEVGVNVPVGTYGGAGLGTFRYRLLYDFS